MELVVKDLPFEALVKSQKDAAELLEVAYFKLGKNYEIASKVREDSIALRQLSIGCAHHLAKFSQTANSVLDSLPEVREALEIGIPGLALDIIKLYASWVTEMKNDALQTRNQCNTLISTLNRNIEETKGLKTTQDDKVKESFLLEEHAQHLKKVAQGTQKELNESSNSAERKLQELKQIHDTLQRKDARDDLTYSEKAIDFVGSLFGIRKKHLENARNNLVQKQAVAGKTLTEQHQQVFEAQAKVEENRREQAELVNKVEVLRLLRDNIGDPRLLADAVSSLTQVDNQLLALVDFWNKMEQAISVLVRDNDTVQKILETVMKNDKARAMFDRRLDDIEKKWGLFHTICNQYSKEIEVQMPEIYRYIGEILPPKEQEARVKQILASHQL